MICKRIEPCPFVSLYIKEYLLIHLVFNPSETTPIKTYPVNPKTGITFQFRGKLIAETPQLNIVENRPAINIFGIPSARQNFFLTNEFMLINVEFQPLALSKFLKIPLNELYNSSLDASLVLGDEIKEVNDHLANAESYDELPVILNHYFSKKIKGLQSTFRPVDNIARNIMENPMHFKLDKIARDSCMSYRTLENFFLRQTGVTPKYFARISRFYQAYVYKEMFPEQDWLSIAVQHGYSDYQHLVKDFKQFAGVTPTILIQQVNKNPERRLSINPNFTGI